MTEEYLKTTRKYSNMFKCYAFLKFYGRFHDIILLITDQNWRLYLYSILPQISKCFLSGKFCLKISSIYVYRRDYVSNVITNSHIATPEAQNT